MYIFPKRERRFRFEARTAPRPARGTVGGRVYHLLVLAQLLFAVPVAAAASSSSFAEQDAFFERLVEACGSTFTGKAVYPEDPGEDWRGQTLVAHIASCEADEVRIPFVVGENRSRTWLLRRVEGGIELKHDHRHEDGSPDEVTMYGGTTGEAGTERAQSFPADEYTAELIPEASTNEWFLSFSENGEELTYYLERHGKPRFKAVLRKD